MAGIYIMLNTVKGGGDGQLGKKINQELGEKMKKGETYLSGEKINFKRGGGGNDQHAQYISLKKTVNISRKIYLFCFCFDPTVLRPTRTNHTSLRRFSNRHKIG